MSDSRPFPPPASDISQAQRAEQFELLVERATDFAIFLLDPEGNISTWNEGARRILFTPEDVAKGEAKKELEQAAREGRSEDERWHVRKDRSRFFASGILMQMQGGEQHRFIKVLRDNTARKQAEEERLRQRAQIAVLEERNRMAQELHDTLSQGFTGIAVQLEAAKDILISEPHTAEGHINRASSLGTVNL